jgi:hypothetical protein
LPNVKNATSYFENGLKNRFRAIAIRAVHHFPYDVHYINIMCNVLGQ